MNNDVISGKRLRNIMIMFLLGSSLIIKAANYAPHCAWISEIIAILLAVPMLLIYARLATIDRDKNLYDFFYDSFGKTGGAIATTLFLLYSLWLASAVIRNYVEFISITFFPETPHFFISIFAGVVLLYTINKGLEVTSKAISFVIIFLVALILTTVLLSVSNMDFTHIFPLFAESPKNIFQEAYSYLTFPYLEIVMFTTVTPLLKKQDSAYKAYMYSLFFAAPLFLIIYFRNLFVLGGPGLKIFYFPSYSAASLINIAQFITRVEVVAASNYTLCILLKSLICIYSSCKGLCKLFKVEDYKVFTAPTILLMVFLSEVIYENIFDMFKSLIIYRPFFLFFEVAIPLLTYIFVETRYRKQKTKTAKGI